MNQDEFYYTTTTPTSSTDWGTWASPTLGWDVKPCRPEQYGNSVTITCDNLTKQPLKEGIEMKNLYEVFLVYGEDRKAPVISATERVIANDDEDARVKSGIYSKIEKEWDADYLTILVRNLGAVKIKEKAKEVKNV